MGNRETFPSPSMQWISAGSGIEHAEGGGTPAGQYTTGWQIWVNVPSDKKMDDPRYGTHTEDTIPDIDFEKYPGFKARVLAGEVDGNKGPFHTVQPVQMVDFYSCASNSIYIHNIPNELDNAILYVYQGSCTIAKESVPTNHAIRLDATDPNIRTFSI